MFFNKKSYVDKHIFGRLFISLIIELQSQNGMVINYC